MGEVFYKFDADQARAATEAKAMGLAPIPTPEILWWQPPVTALAALSGTALGESSAASSMAWVAAGAAVRRLHEAPLPPWPGRNLRALTVEVDDACRWLVEHDVVPVDAVTRHRRIAQAALRPWRAVFTHGDLQPSHVFVDGHEITAVIDWSEAAPGDALYDLATLTLGHPEYLDDVIAGYGADVDLDVVRGWWSLRSLRGARWLIEHDRDPAPEIAVLNSRP